MALQDTSHFPSGDIVYLERSKDTSALLHLHGGTLISWRCKGRENIYLSSTAVFDNKKAIRGGVPVVFPKFGPWDLGPQHGFARIKRWNVEEAPKTNSNGNVVAVLSLQDDGDTRAMWSHKFKLLYTLELCEDSLSFRFAVQNNGANSFDFTCLLHTYFRIPNIETTNISGLKGLSYSDKVKDGADEKELREDVIVDENYDRVYRNAPSKLQISCPPHKMELVTSNFSDVVVWNPWMEKAKAMGDFDDLGYKEMICVEAGQVSTPVTLGAGQNYECSQILKSLL